MSYINENGRVSLHLIDYHGVCVLDLDCNVIEMPKAVYCEVFHESWGVQDYFRTQSDHAAAHPVHEAYGYELTDVYCNEDERNYYWTNDAGEWVQGDELPTIWYANYQDIALVAKC